MKIFSINKWQIIKLTLISIPFWLILLLIRKALVAKILACPENVRLNGEITLCRMLDSNLKIIKFIVDYPSILLALSFFIAAGLIRILGNTSKNPTTPVE